MNVLVFKTNISSKAQAKKINSHLQQRVRNAHIHIDLEDCDNVLRIESDILSNTQVIYEMNTLGVECSPL